MHMTMTFPYVVVSATVTLVSSVEGGVCPEDTVTFTCTVNRVVLQWKISDKMPKNLDAITMNATLGPFQLEVTDSTASSITSTASLTANRALNGTTITCSDPALLSNTETGTVLVIGKLHAWR